MKNFKLFMFVFLLCLGNGCKSVAQESNVYSSKNTDLSVSQLKNQTSENYSAKESEKIVRQIIDNDRRKFLHSAFNEKLFQPSKDVLFRFSQVCELVFSETSLDVIEIETFNPTDAIPKVIYQTLIFNKTRKIVNKLEVKPLYCDGEKLYTEKSEKRFPYSQVLIFNQSGQVKDSEDRPEREIVYEELKHKPIDVYKKKIQEKGIDERQPEYEIDERKLSKTRLNDRKKYLAETIRDGFSQLNGIAFVQFSQVCELETGKNIFYVIDVNYALHNASSDRGQEQVLIFDKENKIVNKFYTDLSPKFCDGDKLYLFDSINPASVDGREMSFDEEGKISDPLNEKHIKLNNLSVYDNLEYKPVETESLK